ncbi:MAG: hypothetical protein OYM47_15730 [Gemmatimonadota bacterium]|nr:hypothetical protein [Gemmatimonadota bacterium]
MRQYTTSEVETIVKGEAKLNLKALIRVGTRQMLQAALEFEVDAYVETLQDERDEQGHRHKERDLITAVGPIPIRQPRVNDRREGTSSTRRALSSSPVHAAPAKGTSRRP